MRYLVDPQHVASKMEARGIKSLGELAEKANVHRNTVYPLVRGERSPFLESFLAICSCLNSDPLSIISPVPGKDLSFLTQVARDCVEKFSPDSRTLAVFLFGSRASGKAKQFSDYDIGLTGGESPISSLTFLRMKEFILERVDDLTVKVDIVNFDDAPDWFMCDFESEMIPLAGNTASLSFLKGVIHVTKKRAKAR